MRKLCHKGARHLLRRAGPRGQIAVLALILTVPFVWPGCRSTSVRAPHPTSSTESSMTADHPAKRAKPTPQPNAPGEKHVPYVKLKPVPSGSPAPPPPPPISGSGGGWNPGSVPAAKNGTVPPGQFTPVDFTAVDRALASLPKGNIAFNAPQTMVLGQSYPIYLLLSPQASVQNLQQELQQQLAGAQNLQGASIQITPEMEARLTGDNFSIAAEGNEKQLVTGEGETRWKWDVTPRRVGTGELHLTLSVFLNVNGGPVPRSIQTFDRRITVEVTWGQRFSDFFGGHWEWILVVIIIPVAKWLWDKRRKQKTGRGSAGP